MHHGVRCSSHIANLLRSRPERNPTVDNAQFDALVKKLASSTSRRSGIRAMLGIAATGAFVADADAHRGANRRHEKLACRGTGSDCTTGDECCSGRCIAKSIKQGGGFRCGRPHRKHKDNGGKSGGGFDPCADLMIFSTCTDCPAGACGVSTNGVVNGCTVNPQIGIPTCCVADTGATPYNTQNAPNFGCCEGTTRIWTGTYYACMAAETCIGVLEASCDYHTSQDKCCYPMVCDEGTDTCVMAPVS